MERNEQPHEEAEETLDQINKKTGSRIVAMSFCEPRS